MPGFLESLGRTNALPSSIKNLSDLALSIRQQKQGAERLDIAKAGEARQAKQFQFEQEKQQQIDAANDKIVSINGLIPGMNFPEVAPQMIQDAKSLGYEVDDIDPNNIKIRKGDLIVRDRNGKITGGLLADLTGSQFAIKYPQIIIDQRKQTVQEATEALRLYREKNPTATIKEDKKLKTLTDVLIEEQEALSLGNNMLADASDAHATQQKFEREGAEKERLAGEERKRKKATHRQTIDSLKKTIKEIDPTASVSDDVQSLRNTLSAIRSAKTAKGVTKKGSTKERIIAKIAAGGKPTKGEKAALKELRKDSVDRQVLRLLTNDFEFGLLTDPVEKAEKVREMTELVKQFRDREDIPEDVLKRFETDPQTRSFVLGKKVGDSYEVLDATGTRRFLFQ